MTENELLRIDSAKWQEMYDFDFTPYLEILQYGDGARYVSWSYATMLLNLNFPDYEVRFHKSEYGTYYHIDHTPMYVMERVLKEYTTTFIDHHVSLLDNVSKTLENNTVESRTIGYLNIYNSMQQQIYDNLNPYLLPYIYDTKTGAKTESIYYPIMGKGSKSIKTFPDNVTLNKNIMRSMVKTIGMFLGLGLRAWTGEDIDGSDKPDILLRVRNANDKYKSVSGGKDHPSFLKQSLHMGMTVPELMQLGTVIAQDTRKLEEGVKSKAVAK